MKKTNRSVETGLEILASSEIESAAREAMKLEGHDPMRELIRVTQGRAPRWNRTVRKAIVVLECVAQTNPEVAEYVLALKREVETELLGLVSQKEINRINLALLPYQHAPLKPVEPPPPEEIGDGTFAQAVAKFGARSN